MLCHADPYSSARSMPRGCEMTTLRRTLPMGHGLRPFTQDWACHITHVAQTGKGFPSRALRSFRKGCSASGGMAYPGAGRRESEQAVLGMQLGFVDFVIDAARRDPEQSATCLIDCRVPCGARLRGTAVRNLGGCVRGSNRYCPRGSPSRVSRACCNAGGGGACLRACSTYAGADWTQRASPLLRQLLPDVPGRSRKVRDPPSSSLLTSTHRTRFSDSRALPGRCNLGESLEKLRSGGERTGRPHQP